MSACDKHGNGPGSKSRSLYVTVVLDGIRWKRRLRLCDDCVQDVRSTYAAQWSDGFVLTKFGSDTACVSCGTVREAHQTLIPMYATGYGLRDQRYDYYATYCAVCAQSVVSQFALQPDGSHAA